MISVPVRSLVLDTGGYISQQWLEFLQALGADPRRSSSSGLIADIPSGLKKSDTGYLYTATDYARVYRWTGTAWERAEGAADPHRYIWCDANPGAGWALANGSSITRTKDDGTTESYTPKNLIGKYLKGAAVAAGPLAAVAPGITGGTIDPAGAHSHTVTTGGPTATVGIASGAGVVVNAASIVHTHTGTTSTEPDHTHTISAITADTAAEMARVELIPYYRQ